MTGRSAMAAVLAGPEGRLSLAYDIVTASAGEIEKISPECFALLGRPAYARLRVWETSGELSSFDEDIVGGRERTFTLRHARSGAVSGPFLLKRDGTIRLGPDDFRLLVDQELRGKPMQFVLKRVTNTLLKSEPFLFADGAKVVVGGDAFTLKVGKPPVAQDPAKPAGAKVAAAE
jgi:hypothetical protein